MKPRFLLTLLLSSIVLLSSCDSDDSDDSNTPGGQPEAGTFTAVVDGESFSSSWPFATAIVTETSNGGFTIALAGTRVSTSESEAVTVGVVGSDFMSLTAGSVFTGQSSNTLAYGGYALDQDDGTEISASSEDNSSAICTITAIDFDAKLISGTFSFEAIDGSTGQVITVTEGVFTNLNYTISGTGGENPVASISAEIDGTPFSSSGIFVFGFLSSTSIIGDYLLIGGSQYQGDLVKAMTLNMYADDFSAVSVGTTYSGDTDDLFFFGQYNADDDGNIDFESRSDSVASATCVITELDPINKLVSGEFSFDAIDEDTNEVYEVRNGVFTNIHYGQ